MIINFLGDSITEGAGASKFENTYVQVVGSILDCKVNNYGVSGTRFARQTTPSNEPRYDLDFNLRALDMEKDVDYVFVFGGTNDYGHGEAEIGTIDDDDYYTFYGALNKLCTYLTKTYSKDKICFILPIKRYKQDNIYGEGSKKKASLTLDGYINVEKQVLDKFGLTYISFDKFFPEPKVNTGDELTVDGLHPNDKGHRILAEQICNYILNK